MSRTAGDDEERERAADDEGSDKEGCRGWRSSDGEEGEEEGECGKGKGDGDGDGNVGGG